MVLWYMNYISTQLLSINKIKLYDDIKLEWYVTFGVKKMTGKGHMEGSLSTGNVLYLVLGSYKNKFAL